LRLGAELNRRRLPGIDFLFKFDETAAEGNEHVAAEVVACIEVMSDLVKIDTDLAELMEGGLIVFVGDADLESGLAEILGQTDACSGGLRSELFLFPPGNAELNAAATIHGFLQVKFPGLP